MPTTLKPAADSATKRSHPARQRALQPYMDKIRGWMDQVADTDPDRSARINVGTRAMNVEPWDRTQLAAFFAAEPGKASDTAELMAHSVALVLKTMFDVERLAANSTASSSDLYALQAELMLDTALGMALLDETQKVIDVLVQGGRVLDAKAMSQFRHQISRTVGEAKKRIADSEVQQAETLSRSLGERTSPVGPELTASPTPPSEATAAPTLDPDAAEPTTPRPRRRTKPVAQAAPGPGMAGSISTPIFPTTRFLSIVLVGLALIWGGAILLPQMTDTAPPRILRSELADPELFTDLRTDPPSMYAVIDAERWGRLDTAERHRVIADLGHRAESNGYRGILLTTTEGQPVARWLNMRGPELIEDAEDLPFEAVGY